MLRTPLPSGRKSLVLLAITIIGGAWWWWAQPHPPRDPVCQGRRLSEVVFDPQFQNCSDFARVHEKLNGYGPAGVAWLAYQAEHGRRLSDLHDPQPFAHAPDWLRSWVPKKWGGLRGSPILDERRTAVFALMLLDRDATPAIPALTRNLDNEDPVFAKDSAQALQYTGAASWPVVHEALEHKNTELRTFLLGTMYERLGTGFEPMPDADMEAILADLTKASNDPDAKMRAAAASGLGGCYERRPDIPLFEAGIPIIIRLLSDPDTTVRWHAASAIGACGAKGVPATTRLIELLDDPSPSVRANAAVALGYVDQAEKRSATRLRILLHDDPDRSCRDNVAIALKALGLAPHENSAGGEALPAR